MKHSGGSVGSRLIFFRGSLLIMATRFIVNLADTAFKHTNEVMT